MQCISIKQKEIFQKGLSAHKDSNYLQAIKYYKEVIMHRPNCTSAVVNLGLSLIELKKNDEASILWQSFILVNNSKIVMNYFKDFFYSIYKGTDYIKIYNKGLSLRMEGNYKRSLQVFKQLGCNQEVSFKIRLLSIVNAVICLQKLQRIDEAIGGIKFIIKYSGQKLMNKFIKRLQKIQNDRIYRIRSVRNRKINRTQNRTNQMDINLLSQIMKQWSQPNTIKTRQPIKKSLIKSEVKKSIVFPQIELNYIKQQPIKQIQILSFTDDQRRRSLRKSKTKSFKPKPLVYRRIKTQQHIIQSKQISPKSISLQKQQFISSQEKANYVAGILLVPNQPQKALSYLKQAFKITSNHSLYLQPITQSLQKLGRLKQLQHFYVMLLQPHDSQSYRRLGWLQVERGKLSQGVNNLEKADSLDPFNRLINKQLSQAYLVLCSNQSIQSAIYRLQSLKVPTYQQKFILARCYFSCGQFSLCKQLLLQAQKCSKNPQIYYFLGRLEQQKGNIQQSTKYYKKAIKIDSSFSLAANKLAEMLLSNNQLQPALKILKQVFQIDPLNQKACWIMVLIAQNFQKNDMAIEYLQRLLKKNDQDVLALYKLGSLLLERKQAIGKSYLKKCVLLQNNHYQAWLKLGKYQLQNHKSQHDLNKALKIFNQLKEFQLNQSEIQQIKVLIAECNDALNFPQQALNLLSKCYSLKSKELTIKILLRLGRGIQTIPIYQQHLKQYSDAHLHFQISKQYYNEGRVEQGQQALKRSLLVNENFVPAIFAFGIKLVGLNEKQKAFELLQRGISIQTNLQNSLDQLFLSLLQRKQIQMIRRIIEMLKRSNYHLQYYQQWQNSISKISIE